MTNRRTHETIPARLDRLERFAHDMDDRFRVPMTNIRFGWDAVIGLVPAEYIFFKADAMDVPLPVKWRMAGNLLIDRLVGSIQLGGDIIDVEMKENRRNTALLRRHFDNAVDLPERVPA